jgi:hypothetical protein
MPIDLKDVFLKIERSNHHRAELKSVLAAFKASRPYVYRAKCDPETKEIVYSIVEAKDPPPLLSVIAGDVLQNLRTALDYLICATVIGNGKTPSTYTGFPILKCVPTTKDEIASFRRKIEGIGQPAENLLDSIKPYKGGDETLWRLHRLNNRDKHQLLLTVGIIPRTWNFGAHFRKTRGLDRYIPDAYLQLAPGVVALKAGAEIFRDPPNSRVDEDIQLVLDVAFNEPGIVTGEPVLTVLRMSHNRVMRIVAKFEELP